MARFVPKDKLSKKAQKELNRQRRTMWDFSPVSRAVDSKKLYNRKKRARDRYDDYGASSYHFRLVDYSFLSRLKTPTKAPTMSAGDTICCSSHP